MPKIRVLLAEDHEQMREYAHKILSAEYEVVAAVNDGQAALDAVAKLHPDIVVLDVSMPVLNGFQVARRLREMDPDAKIIFLTAEKDPDIRRAALETGALGYVLKPRLGTDLILAVKQANLGHRFVSEG